MQQSNEGQMTSQQHAAHISQMLYEAQQECRMDIGRVNDPKAQALFETVAEVIGGTRKALDDYRARDEQVWQESGRYMTPPRGRSAPTRSDLSVDVDAAKPPPRVSDMFPGDNA